MTKDTMVQFKTGLLTSSPAGCTILIDYKTMAIEEFKIISELD